jgi:hypothetical protein
MNNKLNVIGRLSLTALTTVAIGWGFVSLNPPDENGETKVGVQESSADIFGMTFAERTSTQKFQSALDKMGHEKPRVYDYNGNTVMFSTNQVRGSVNDVLRDYMQTFADEGVNPEVFERNVEPGSAKHRTMVEAALNGGIVPRIVRDDYMSIGGSVIDVTVPDVDTMKDSIAATNKSESELLDNLEDAFQRCGGNMAAFRAAMADPSDVNPFSSKGKLTPDKVMSQLCEGGGKPSGGYCGDGTYTRKLNGNRLKAIGKVLESNPAIADCAPMREASMAIAGWQYDSFTEKIRGYRSIEAWHDKSTGLVNVTAAWSDENFDAKKAQPSRYGTKFDNDAARKIPLCHNCRRIYAFEGTGAERPYQSNIIISPSDPARTAYFYSKKMQDEGWEVPESELVTDELLRLADRQDPNNQWLRFRRGTEFLAVHVSRDKDGHTVVRTHTAP